MYRVLIVDDEPEIRQGLRLKIDADKLGLELAGEASNGVEALGRLEEEAYDIVITDMNMPVMDGVSFLEACRERHPDVRLVVITGYEDFQYARAALRHQASDYLLKPVAADELADVLAKVTAELDGERQETAREERTRWELSQYYKEMKEQFVVRLIKGELDREAATLERARRFGLDAWAEAEVRFLTVGLRERSGAPARRQAMPADEDDTTASGESATANRSGKPEGECDAANGRISDRSPDQFRLPLELICRERALESGGGLRGVSRCELSWPRALRDRGERGLAAGLRRQARGADGRAARLRAGRRLRRARDRLRAVEGRISLVAARLEFVRERTRRGGPPGVRRPDRAYRRGAQGVRALSRTRGSPKRSPGRSGSRWTRRSPLRKPASSR
ncbi:response regulator [Cohnella ginsengisoli]|uniref:Response regulator n=1 Tax=Cohnella ginsengisoli TaxID=425004 RepID=A0A9X4KES3_9BACL|nr:response regulator [Cohnella ginsengisoli]MDG0790814.1 response regulator [Cohnella ginsengisoli]